MSDKRTVLVADDHADIRTLVSEYLNAGNFHVLTACNGEEALAIFHRSSPDLMILDLNMPGCDGAAVCRQVRENSAIPIIVLSARTEDLDKILLLELGADVVELPTIRIEPPADREEFSRLVTDVHTYDWVVFTSPNGVERFFEAFFAAYEDARSFGKPRIAAIGPATARKIAEYRFATDLLPEKFVAEGLVEAFKKEHIESQTILWVKAEETRDVLYDELMDQGAIVDRCIAYRNVPESEDPTGAVERLAKDGADVITFTSGSTVESFFALGIPWPEGCKAASIGPVTSGKLREKNQEPVIEASESDIPGLVRAIVAHFGGQSGE